MDSAPCLSVMVTRPQRLTAWRRHNLGVEVQGFPGADIPVASAGFVSQRAWGGGPWGEYPVAQRNGGPACLGRLRLWHGRDGMAAQMMVSYRFQASPTSFRSRDAPGAVPYISDEPDRPVSELEATSLRWRACDPGRCRATDTGFQHRCRADSAQNPGGVDHAVRDRQLGRDSGSPQPL